jgi:hypothetical protein
MRLFHRRRRTARATEFESATFTLYFADAGYACLLLEKGGVEIPHELTTDVGEEFAHWYFGVDRPSHDDFFEAASGDPEAFDRVIAERLADRFEKWLDERR